MMAASFCKRTRVPLSAATCLTLLAGGAADAQRQEISGSRITEPAPAEIRNSPRLGDADRTRATLFAFGVCEIARSRQQSLAALAAPPTKQSAQLAKLATSDCLENGTLSMSAKIMRGSLYAALYKTDFKNEQPNISAKLIDYSIDLGGEADGDQYVSLHDFADCVVRDDAADSRQLLYSTVGSDSENRAFASLAPHFNYCLSKGNAVAFSKVVIEGLVAETLYRESVAARQRIAETGMR